MKKIVFMISIAVIVSLISGCSDSDENTKSDEYYRDQYSCTIEQIATSSTKLEVSDYSSGDGKVTFSAEDPAFLKLVNLLQRSEVTRIQPRIVIQEGKTVEAAIPYAINYVLTFFINDGSSFNFDYGEELWFSGDEAIYGISVGADFGDILSQMKFYSDATTPLIADTVSSPSKTDGEEGLLLSEGIGGWRQPKALTEVEKTRVVEIALNSPEASEWLQGRTDYRTAPVAWYAIIWNDHGVGTWWAAEYEIVDDGIPSYISPYALWYPGVTIAIGEGTIHQMPGQCPTRVATGTTKDENGNASVDDIVRMRMVPTSPKGNVKPATLRHH